MRRLKLHRFKRNICVVIGNVGSPDDLDALMRIRDEADQMVAEHAAWAIDQIKGRED